ncbi:hypothetical protein GCM10009828_082150 [Actinoplanes couchii]|uniref:TetR family transcriptional regulator n=1 Tax=Actinoplanes couchii TaxID=403638 RepID=A0ABQ3XKZ1_9ACTN|nr:hypothetical protein Aco03nite_075600 [Actinoplanes couchii]
MDTTAIAAAVLAVGFRDLTFTAVAAHLRIGQATLYRHAANRDELVRLGLDLAVNRVTWPGLEGPWREVMETWALAAWHAYAGHPGAAAEMTRGVVPHSVLLLSDKLGAMLIGHGFRPADAVLAVDLVFDLAVDHRRGVEDLGVDLRRGVEDLAVDHRRGVEDLTVGDPAVVEDGRKTMRDHVETQWAAPVDGTPEAAIRAEMLRAIRADPIDWFHGKLRVVLAGIASELAPRKDAGEPAPRKDARKPGPGKDPQTTAGSPRTGE